MMKKLLNKKDNSKIIDFKLLLLALAFSFSQFTNAQTTIISPTGDGGFESGTTFALNGWTATTGGANQNQWVCNTGATTGFTGTRAAYVTNARNSTPPPHTYTTATTRYTHIYRSVTIPAGETDIQLNFDWIGIGESGFFGNYDYLRVWKVPNNNGNLPAYGTALGANANRIILAEINDQATWTNQNINLPTNLAGTTFRLVFEWTNDASSGSNPPIAVDNISLTSDILTSPGNDLCANATSLPCGTTNLAGTTINTSNIANGTGCFMSDYGVWYTFTGDGDQTTIDVSGTGGFDVEVAIESGSCGSFTNLNCEDAGDPESYTFTTVNGTDYYVYVAYWTSGATTGNFTISRSCSTPPTTPTNDLCANATSLPCGTTNLAGTTINTSNIANGTGCFMSDYGVWYTFTGDGDQTTIDVSGTGGFDVEVAIESGSCGTFTNLNCEDSGNPESYTFTTVNGTDYYVYVAYWTSGATTGNFTISRSCTTPPTPATNDEPCTAIALTPDGTCITTSGNVIGATDSGIDACFGTPDNDVWYSFVATDSNHTVSLTNIVGSETDMYLSVYGSFTPPDCSVAVGDNIDCSDANSTDLTGLTVGGTYFIQVFTYYSGPATTTFDICVTGPCSNSDPINNTPTVCPLIAGELGVDPFTIDPFDPDPSYSLDCTSPSLTLQAHSTIRETDSYIVEQIAYPSPAPEYDWSVLGGAGVQTINNDDVWAETRTNIGFNFCYYGNTYTETLVGANGMITFDSAYLPDTSCGYSFNDNLPSLAGALFNNTIYGVYHDIDPTGLTGTPIKSRLIGTPGCRQFIVSWFDIPMFGDATRLYTGMIVLHETTNIIEVFIEEKRIENGNVAPWNGGNAIVGLQGDANAGEAITAPCRNGLDTNWETTNGAWRFVPNGAIIAPDSVEWFSASTGSTVIGTGTTLAITTPDNYTAEVTYTTCGNTVTFSDDVVVNQSSKTWMGYIDNNWYVDGNWEPNGIPTSGDCVLIPDIAVSNVDFPIANVSNIPIPLPPQPGYALNLTIATTATLDVLANTELVVTDWIHLDGNISIRDTASLIQVNDGAANVNNNTGTGSVNMQRTATIASSYDYIYWSSPVEGFGVSNISPGSTYIYEWIPTIAGNGVGNYGNWQATTESMINGKGYIIRNVTGTPTPSTPEFVGRPNNGVITKAITRGTYNLADYAGGGSTVATRLDDNWNLVGNPYPSAISADTFITVNAGIIDDDTNPAIAGTVYLWRHLVTPSNAEGDPFYSDFVYNYNPNDYVAYNSTGSNPPGFGGDIAAGQSFFVLMEHAAPVASNVVFNNTMRNETLDNSQFYRETKSNNRLTTEKHRVWLDLITPNSTANSILVGYTEGATNNFDRLFDGHELSGTSNRFYSIIDTEEFAIQGKALPFVDTDTVPLGVEISENGNYSIAINTLDGLFQDTDQTIYIEDTYTNTIHNLRVNPYSFNIDAGLYNDRFILRYNDEALSIDDFEITGLEISAPNNSYIKVKSGSSIINTVIVYDLLGRALIHKKDINYSEITFNDFNFSEGTYIVKAILTNGKQKIQKVVLKH